MARAIAVLLCADAGAGIGRIEGGIESDYLWLGVYPGRCDDWGDNFLYGVDSKGWDLLGSFKGGSSEGGKVGRRGDGSGSSGYYVEELNYCSPDVFLAFVRLRQELKEIRYCEIGGD